MSFAINQAETFNYKTNYEVVNVSHLTQPTSKQNRTFSGGEEEKRKRGREAIEEERGDKKTDCLTDVFVDIFFLIASKYVQGRETKRVPVKKKIHEIMNMYEHIVYVIYTHGL